MFRFLGIRPNHLLIALAGVAALAAGLAVHRPVLDAVGALLIAWAAVRLVAGRGGSGR